MNTALHSCCSTLGSLVLLSGHAFAEAAPRIGALVASRVFAIRVAVPLFNGVFVFCVFFTGVVPFFALPVSCERSQDGLKITDMCAAIQVVLLCSALRTPNGEWPDGRNLCVSTCLISLIVGLAHIGLVSLRHSAIVPDAEMSHQELADLSVLL